MNASESQHILSRLYTDAEYRNSFLANREMFYEEYRIENRDIKAFLDALKPEQLQFFAKGLYAKKYHEVARIIPGTAYLLKAQFGLLFKKFSGRPQSYGIHKHQEEALAFIQFLKKSQTLSKAEQNVLRFEENQVQQFLQPKGRQMIVFRYDVLDFLRVIQSGETPVLKRKLMIIGFRDSKVHWVFRL